MVSNIPRKKQNNKRPPKKQAIDYLVYFAIVIGPILTMPQIYSIWFEKQKGVSVISWIAYFIASVIWLLYAIKQKDKLLIIVQTIWVFLDAFIILGLLLIS